MTGVRDQYGLTAKQRKFAENLADGMSQSDAYRNAYDASDMLVRFGRVRSIRKNFHLSDLERVCRNIVGVMERH